MSSTVECFQGPVELKVLQKYVNTTFDAFQMCSRQNLWSGFMSCTWCGYQFLDSQQIRMASTIPFPILQQCNVRWGIACFHWRLGLGLFVVSGRGNAGWERTDQTFQHYSQDVAYRWTGRFTGRDPHHFLWKATAVDILLWLKTTASGTWEPNEARRILSADH